MSTSSLGHLDVEKATVVDHDEFWNPSTQFRYGWWLEGWKPGGAKFRYGKYEGMLQVYACFAEPYTVSWAELRCGKKG